MVTALVLLNVERSKVNTVAEMLAAMNGVSEVYSVAGRYDLAVIIRVKDNEQMAELVTNHMLKVDGIIKGAMPFKKQYLSDGSVEITLVMRMQGDFLNAVVPETFGGASAPLPPLRPAPSVQPPAIPKPAPPVQGKQPEPKKVEPAKPAPPQPEKKPDPPKVVPNATERMCPALAR